MASLRFRPVAILREHGVALEAALTVCLADPAHKAVHRLRTGTRRVEALLELLGQMPGIPEHNDEAHGLRKPLRKLRRAAGKVRDLDVQIKRLEEMAATSRPSGSDEERSSALRLREGLLEHREAAAGHLQHFLQKGQIEIAKAVEALLKELEPATDMESPALEALGCAERLLLTDGLLTAALTRTLVEDELHTVRKFAKAARYLAEMLPRTTEAKRAAQRFEALQEAGGHWHDALELARLAKGAFGKGDALTSAFAAERDRNLRLYREALRTEARRDTLKTGVDPTGADPSGADL